MWEDNVAALFTNLPPVLQNSHESEFAIQNAIRTAWHGCRFGCWIHTGLFSHTMSVRFLRCLSESGTVPPPGTVPPLEPLNSQRPFST